VVRENSALGKGCRSGTAATRRRFAFWNASCALSVHSSVFGPPSGDQLRDTTLVHNLAKNDGENSPCRENVVILWCPEGGGGHDFIEAP
jgi:hypothetical protein